MYGVGEEDGVCRRGDTEVLQLHFMIGFLELDDVKHNTVGCLVGFLIVSEFHHITAAVNHLQRASR